MIKPTIGRKIWVIRPAESLDIKQPEDGTIVYVHSDRCINVAGFDANGDPFKITSLTLLQDDDAKPEGSPFACWMPFQKTAAAKEDSGIESAQAYQKAYGANDKNCIAAGCPEKAVRGQFLCDAHLNKPLPSVGHKEQAAAAKID